MNILTEFDILGNKDSKQSNEYYINLFILGDLFKILPKIPNGLIKVIICDPPYAISVKRKFVRKDSADITLNFGKWDFFGEGQERMVNYLNFIFKLLDEFYRVLSEDGTLYLFCADTYISFIEYYAVHKLKLHKNQNFLFPIWEKTNPPPSFFKKNYLQSWEFCLVFEKNRKKSTFNYLGENEMHNFYKSGVVSGKERLKDARGKTLHPTQKPKELIRKFIKVSSNKGDLIGDLMAGTFTTSVVAKEEGRDVIACEKSYKYFKYGTARYNDASLKKEHRLKIKNELPIKNQSKLSNFLG